MSKKDLIINLGFFIGMLAILATGYLWYLGGQKDQRITDLLSERNFFQNEMNNKNSELEVASSTIFALETRLLELGENIDDLTDDYKKERDKNEDFQDQIKDISKTVGVLDKLSKTDEELLQKYSKVYFLNEHYVPESLKILAKENIYDESRTFELHSKVMPYFEEMVTDAKTDGIELWVVSAYRSFGQQAALKGAYLTTYGSGANAFSADQGFSEHQLGTTIDFTTKGLGGGLDGFNTTPAYAWLLENAHKYGFTLSYPEGNAYYVYEPWHWRFVGEDLAQDLRKDNAHFYDWEQRKIDAYLISIFD
jgi:LAS superfamily LD-carboxypeptidase LdcB